MTQYSIDLNFSSRGFDLNFFSQLDIYFSYLFIAFIVAVIVGLRIRKVLKMRKYRK